MIEQTTFLGISLRTLAYRRALVVVYYVFLLAFLAIPLSRHKFMPSILIVQTLTLGGLFGGIRTGGLVKNYADHASDLDPDMRTPISLNLSGRATPFTPWNPLDERERAARDRAHYVAYRILILSLALGFVLLFLSLKWTLVFFEQNAATLLWLLLVYVLSLPQSVILWTEPEPLHEGTLTLVDAKR